MHSALHHVRLALAAELHAAVGRTDGLFRFEFQDEVAIGSVRSRGSCSACRCASCRRWRHRSPRKSRCHSPASNRVSVLPSNSDCHRVVRRAGDVAASGMASDHPCHDRLHVGLSCGGGCGAVRIVKSRRHRRRVDSNRSALETAVSAHWGAHLSAAKGSSLPPNRFEYDRVDLFPALQRADSRHNGRKAHDPQTDCAQQPRIS